MTALSVVPDDDDGEPSISAKDLSEVALAARFTTEYGMDWIHVAQLGKWFRWGVTQFKEDTVRRVFSDARAIAEDATEQAQLKPGTPKYERVRSKAAIAAIVELARSDRTHAKTVDDLDKDPWLLNTAWGAIKLDTGDLVTNSPKDCCTMRTAVAPGKSSTEAPTWLAALDRWSNNRPEIVAYLQRLAGYALTGSTREHALVFFYGPGGNGKSAFLEALAGCMGSYAIAAPISTFTESAHEQHPTDLARLRGKRLVITSETEANRRWAEAKVKQLTGGDRIAARFMRQDYFEFDPQFTLIVAGNHCPRFASVDEAIRRRLHIVPFDAAIPAAERDPDLPAKLRAEWTGILAWALEGCAEWKRQGLNPPEAVLAATADYIEAEDTFGAWLAECTVGSAGWTPTAELFNSWQIWAHRRGESVETSRKMSDELSRRGFKPYRTTVARGFSGLLIRPMTQLTQSAHIDGYARTHTHARAGADRGYSEPASAASLQTDLLCVGCGLVMMEQPGMLCLNCGRAR